MQAVGDVITYSFVMEDAYDGCATGFGFANQFHHRGAVFMRISLMTIVLIQPY